MNVQSNLQMTGAAPGSVAAGKGNAAKATDAERPFEARFEECCKGDKDAVSRGAQQEPEPDTQEGEKRPKLADAELTDGNADTLLVDSVADEKRDGINDAIQGTMLPDTQPMDPRLLLQFVSAASGSVAVKEGANIPVQADATAKLSGLVRATLGTDQAQQAVSGAGAQPVSELKSLSEGRVSPQLAVASATSGSVAAVEGANNSVHSEVSAKFSGLVRRALPSDPAQQPASSSGAQAMAEAKSLSEGRVSPQLAVQSKQGLAEKPVQGALPNGQVAANVVEADARCRSRLDGVAMCTNFQDGGGLHSRWHLAAVSVLFVALVDILNTGVIGCAGGSRLNPEITHVEDCIFLARKSELAGDTDGPDHGRALRVINDTGSPGDEDVVAHPWNSGGLPGFRIRP